MINILRIKEISSHVNVRHYHHNLPSINGSRPFFQSSTARPGVIQQAFIDLSMKLLSKEK
jgi:hypothetical protein